MKEFYETLRLNDKNRGLSCTVLLFIIMLILPVSLMAQEKSISGRVIDAETNETLVGVSVVIKGTTTGTTTDIDGKFTLQAAPNSILVISYVGYVKQEISVGDQSDIMVQLAENAKLLDEVVVVGFGTQKKVNLTGAVGIATAKDFQDRPVMLAAQALQGLVPGLNISQSNGSLETRSSMSIRGKGSIDSGTNTSPLVLIDGIEGDINTLNPNDIENISVLKDAAASAIYGAKAPYGVILITTKKGVAGKTKVSYSNNFRWSKPILMPQQMDSYTFALYFNDACKDTPGWSPNFNDAWLKAIKDYQTGASRQSTVQSGNTWAEGFDPISSAGGVGGSANEDNYKNFFRSTGFSQEHNLSLSGGSDKVTYYVSGNFLDQKGLMQFNQDGYQRFSVNAKINFKVNKWVDFNYGNRFQRDTYHRPSAMSTSLFTDIGRQCWPIIPLYDPNGNLLSRWGLALRDGGTDKSETDNSYQQAQLVIEPIKNWKTYAEVNYSIYNIDRHWDQQTTYRYDVDGNPYAIGEPRGRDSSVHEESAKENLFGLNLYSEYSFSLDNRNNFKVMVGFQEQSMAQNKNGLTQYGIIFPSLPEIDLTNGLGYDGTAVAPTLNGERNAWATQGVFGRLNYDFEGKYLFEANLRYDVSSRYRTGHRGVVSPAFSAGWNIAQEDFFQPLKSVVDVLKLRVSYGQLANQNTTG
ncbi:hypothetical protein FACS1894169_15730 [Bacteroidia bacterium]|nr:hypothetical protein FACS1894169_15730 [Bacteroidia bacterium]